MKITSYEGGGGDPGMVVLELRDDDLEADYGTQVAPGIHLHYHRGEAGRRIPVYIEIEVHGQRVDMERRNAEGTPLDQSKQGVHMDALLTALREAGVEVTN